MHRIYYQNYNSDEERPPVQDVQIILQQLPGGDWATLHGADFYVRKWDRWVGMNLPGLKNHLYELGLFRPTIGTIHEVQEEGFWEKVDYIGFLEWLEVNDLALFGQIMQDENWDTLVGLALAYSLYAKEHGELPTD